MRNTLLLLCGTISVLGCAIHQNPDADVAVPDTYPLGSLSNAHYDLMQTNGEAGDFVIRCSEFEPTSANLTTAGRDHVLEIAARLCETPFPVIIEPDGFEAAPDLDLMRCDSIARILSDLGVADASQRTMVMRGYSDGLPGAEVVSHTTR